RRPVQPGRGALRRVCRGFAVPGRNPLPDARPRPPRGAGPPRSTRPELTRLVLHGGPAPAEERPGRPHPVGRGVGRVAGTSPVGRDADRAGGHGADGGTRAFAATLPEVVGRRPGGAARARGLGPAPLPPPAQGGFPPTGPAAPDRLRPRREPAGLPPA